MTCAAASRVVTQRRPLENAAMNNCNVVTAGTDLRISETCLPSFNKWAPKRSGDSPGCSHLALAANQRKESLQSLTRVGMCRDMNEGHSHFVILRPRIGYARFRFTTLFLMFFHGHVSVFARGAILPHGACNR